MKKMLPVLFVIVCVVTVAVMVRMRKTPPKEPDTQAPPPVKLVLGEKTVFDMKFRSLTTEEGKSFFYGGVRVEPVQETESTFIAAVKEQTENTVSVFKASSLTGREILAVESKEKEIVAVYFDADADGKLSEADRLAAADIPVDERMQLPNLVSFVTPEFPITVGEDKQIPFKILFRVFQAEGGGMFGLMPGSGGSQVQIISSPYGLYEGTAQINGQDMTLRLYPGYRNLDYAAFGESTFTLHPTSDTTPERMRRYGLSSLVFRDDKYYRILIEDGPEKTLKLTYAEDKGPRGKYTLDFGAKEANFKSAMTYGYVEGATDKKIRLQGSGNELPVGDYMLPYAGVSYGQETTDGYSMSLQNVPAFTVQADQTTTVKLEKAAVKFQAVELKKRYAADKKYKTEFAEDTPVYLDVSIAAANGVSFASFTKKSEVEGQRGTTLKAKIRIADAAGNEVANQELEYG